MLVFTGLVGSAFGMLVLPDQFDVSGGGYGRVAASFEAIINEVGQVVDDTFDGEITFRWTMKWDDFPGQRATASWALFHFFSIDNEELSGVGNHAAASQTTTFNEGGFGQYAQSHASGVEIERGKEYTFELVIDYRAGGPDLARLNGGGFVDQSLFPGDWSFHHVRVRARGDSATRVDFTDMSIASRATGGMKVEQVDPRFPAEQVTAPPATWSRWPWIRIRQLEARRSQLLEAISILPQHHPVFLSTRLGYHSRFEETDTVDALPPNQIDFKWNWQPLLDSIAFAPAFNPKESGSYAFPKRFKIEVRLAETNEFETVVNWMEEDFPDPGLYPVFFAGINRQVSQVRITVPQVEHESGMAYSALGEVYVLQQRLDGSTGANMALWGRGHVEVEAFDSFSMPPLWDIEYLYDGVVGLGLPLSDETVESKDLMVVFEDGEYPVKVQLLLDLGKVQDIGRIDFWPAAPPAGLALPSFGFPGKIVVELSPELDFQTAKVMEVEDNAENVHRETLLSVAAEAYKARYLRVTMSGFVEHKGKRILGLGEISVSEFETVLSTHCKVTAQGIPEQDLNQLPRLVDGCSGHRLILPQGEWIKGLAKRRPLDRRLTVVERELEQARVAWRIIQQRAGILGGSTVVAGLLLGMVLQWRQRHRMLNRLKWRIARDLHDEVGSNLGSISLVAERLEQDVQSEDVKEDLADLSLLAREASVSLRDVVWVIDQTTIRLPELMQKLAERAQRILSDAELAVDIPPDCPDLIVPLTFKRHLIMFFKEVMHNCARHAQATRVQISVCTKDQHLSVRIRDNGCGFDPSMIKDGWGLDSMQKRAQELGGTMKLDSQPGAGTMVELNVPLKALLKNTDHLYKTSN